MLQQSRDVIFVTELQSSSGIDFYSALFRFKNLERQLRGVASKLNFHERLCEMWKVSRTQQSRQNVDSRANWVQALK